MVNERSLNLQLFAEGEGTGKTGEKESEKEENPEKGTSEKTEETKESKTGDKEGGNEGEGEGKEEKLFTQGELEEKIQKRLDRVYKKFGDYDELKQKAEKAEKELEEKRLAEMSEKEQAEELAKRYEQEKTELQQYLEQVKAEAQKEKINNEFIKQAGKYNITYVDDALKLADLTAVEYDEEGGEVKGVEDVVKKLVKEKPFLLAQKEGEGEEKETETIGEGSKRTKDDKTAQKQLQELAEKAKKSGKTEDKMAYVKLKRELEGA